MYNSILLQLSKTPDDSQMNIDHMFNLLFWICNTVHYHCVLKSMHFLNINTLRKHARHSQLSSRELCCYVMPPPIGELMATYLKDKTSTGVENKLASENSNFVNSNSWSQQTHLPLNFVPSLSYLQEIVINYNETIPVKKRTTIEQLAISMSYTCIISILQTLDSKFTLKCISSA